MDFQTELAALLNKHSIENGSDTPDFILAKYIRGCLAAYEMAINERERWKATPAALPDQHGPEGEAPANPKEGL